MKRSWVSVPLRRTDVEPFGSHEDDVEEWLEQKLRHLTALFEGRGRVNVKKVDDLRFDVKLDFVVESSLDVVDRFRKDIEMLNPLAPGIEIREAASFKLCFPKIEGEMLAGIFVRVDPETSKYRDTED